jgi:hypothetical protein
MKPVRKGKLERRQSMRRKSVLRGYDLRNELSAVLMAQNGPTPGTTETRRVGKTVGLLCSRAAVLVKTIRPDFLGPDEVVYGASSAYWMIRVSVVE